MTIKRLWSWLLLLIGLVAAVAYLYQSYRLAENPLGISKWLYVLWAALGLGAGYFVSSGVDMLGDNPRKKKG